MAVAVARRPEDHHHPILEEADRRYSLLAIIGVVVDKLPDRAVDHLIGVVEIEAAFGERCFALRRIVADRHQFT